MALSGLWVRWGARTCADAHHTVAPTCTRACRDEEPTASRAVVEVLETALATSGMSLRRLMALQSTIEAEVASEHKQRERLRFLLDKLQRDYAYYNTLERLQHQKGGNGTSSVEPTLRSRSASRPVDPELEEDEEEEEEQPRRGYASARELERSRHSSWRVGDKPSEPAHTNRAELAEQVRPRRRASWRTQAIDEPERYEDAVEDVGAPVRRQPPSPRRSWRTRLPSRVTESATERRGFSSWEEGLDHGM
jgi:hypothetical protein